MKREKKYTKGEWVANTRINDPFGVYHLETDFNNEEEQFAEIEDEANVSLVSAAPDLLEALEALQEQYIEICNNVGLSHIIEENLAFQKAEKAIAKAYGED